MAEIYLTPQDVGFNDTALVLTFLNGAQTAQEIATRVEIPDELDIGVKLGQRILNARAELGGAFESLEQLMAVPLIGPERFTEIVTEITGRTAVDIVSSKVNNTAPGQLLALEAQLERIKQQLDATEELDQRRYRIELSTLEKTPYLGEIVHLNLKVMDRFRGVSKANMPVTIETSWGNLQYAQGYRISQGSVLNARTGVDGSVAFQLYTPTAEPLTVHQQTELSNALSKLSDAAALPNDAKDDFTQLVSLYRHPLNRDLRTAIDIHYKSRQNRLVDVFNDRASTYAWIHEQALVRVYLHSRVEGEASTVLAIAALPVEYRDWLAPWYQFYKYGLIGDGGLLNSLEESIAYSEDEKGLSSHMIANIQSFISSENGLIGERVGQQASKEVVTRLLTDGFTGLTHNARASLYTLVNQAPDGIQAGGQGALAIADEIAVDVGRRQGVFELNQELVSQVSQLQSTQTSYETRISNIESATANINFDQLTADLNQFNENYSNFNTDYDQFSQDYTQFDQDYTEFGQDYSQFTLDYNQFDLSYLSFNDDLTGFNNNLTRFNTDFVVFNEGVVKFNQTKDQLVINVTKGVNAALRKVQADNTDVVIEPIENIEINADRIDRPLGGG